MSQSKQTVLVDSGFWLAFLDPKDQHHAEAEEKEEFLQLVTPLVPWPTLYEVVRTRFVRRKDRVARFETMLTSLSPIFIDDAKFRDAALAQVWKDPTSLSLVDHIIRLILQERPIRIDYILTFNERDFTDLALKLNIPYFAVS